MEQIDLEQRAKALTGSYENIVLTRNNDHVVRISRMTEPYFWHYHPDSDETFFGIEGVLVLEFEDGEFEYGRVELMPGQMITVPKGVKHRTSPAGASSVNLTVERAEIATLRSDPPAGINHR